MSSEAVLTADRHGDCGSPIYLVGEDREEFCVGCSEKVEL